MPGIMRSAPPEQGTTGTPRVIFLTDNQPVERLKKAGISPILYQSFQPDKISRLLAKIALGIAVGTFGIDSFTPIIRDVILNQSSNPYYLVGGTTHDFMHLKNYYVCGTIHESVAFIHHVNNEPHVLVQIQLFCYLDTPIYTVVVGKMTSEEYEKFLLGLRNVG
jgi:hypothetical protein